MQINQKFNQIWITFSLCLLLFVSNLLGQGKNDIRDQLRVPDSTHVQIISTTDKSTNIGRIQSVREDDIIFKTSFGIIIIPITNIKEVEEVHVSRIKNGVYWFPNPNATRLYFAPTARMLKKGKGYFADYYIFFPAFAYGINDNVTIGAGMSLLPNVDPNEQIFYFTPKIGTQTGENLNIAAGALIVKMPDFDDEDEAPWVGILYGVGTYGQSDASLTFGLGYGFVDDELAKKPFVMLGGEKRFSRRLAFVSENWLMPGVDNPFISYGIRFFGENLSVDLALWNILSDDFIFPGIPYIDFVFNF